MFARWAFFLISGVGTTAVPTAAFEVDPMPPAILTLPQRDDVVAWSTLAETQVAWVPAGEFHMPVPTFSPTVAGLAGGKHRLQGYGFPLEADIRTQTFLLVPMPFDCPFCAVGILDANQMVLVHSDEAVTLEGQILLLEGTFELAADDPMGLFYQLSRADLIQ